MTRPAHRPPSRSRLDPEAERELAWLIGTGVPETDASRQMGLTVPAVRHAMRTTGFAYAIRRVVADRLNNLAPDAVDVLESILKDPKMPGRVRVDAAKAVLDRSGHVAGPIADKGSGVDPSGMSVEQLGAFITQLEREKSDRAVPVGGSDVLDGDGLPNFLN